MKRLATTGALLALLSVAACGRGKEGDEGNRVPLPKTATGPGNQEGVTPMAERIAVLGFLNKRNGIVRDIN